jgi:hypothetical protein
MLCQWRATSSWQWPGWSWYTSSHKSSRCIQNLLGPAPSTNNLDFPQASWAASEMRLTGYRPNHVVETTFFQCSHSAACPIVQPRCLRAGQWELYLCFGRVSCLYYVIGLYPVSSISGRCLAGFGFTSSAIKSLLRTARVTDSLKFLLRTRYFKHLESWSCARLGWYHVWYHNPLILKTTWSQASWYILTLITSYKYDIWVVLLWYHENVCDILPRASITSRMI